jgi:hypothetical protein
MTDNRTEPATQHPSVGAGGAWYPHGFAAQLDRIQVQNGNDRWTLNDLADWLRTLPKVLPDKSSTPTHLPSTSAEDVIRQALDGLTDPVLAKWACWGPKGCDHPRSEHEAPLVATLMGGFDSAAKQRRIHGVPGPHSESPTQRAPEVTDEDVAELAAEIGNLCETFARQNYELHIARGDLPVEERLNEDAEDARIQAQQTAALRAVFDRYAKARVAAGDVVIRAFGPGVYDGDMLRLPTEDGARVVAIRRPDVGWLTETLRDFAADCEAADVFRRPPTGLPQDVSSKASER